MGRIFILFLVLPALFTCKEKTRYVQLTERPQEPLRYYISKDSLIGVKDDKGRIVISARGRWIYDLNDGDTVREGLIHLFELDDKISRPGSSTPGSFGKMYSRDGKFLYNPFMYDNGPDEINEGLTRFVENDKVGFIDRHANRIIPAQFNGVGSFELGTAIFSTGGFYDTTEDREHPLLKDAVYGVVDRRGKILLDRIQYDTSIHFWKKLLSLHQQFYQGQFIYSEFEKNLIARFGPYKRAIERTYFSNWVGFPEPKSLKFDITERPSPGFPYYVIDLAEVVGNEIRRGDQLKFYISENGNEIFNHSWDGQIIPFLEWYREYVNE